MAPLPLSHATNGVATLLSASSPAINPLNPTFQLQSPEFYGGLSAVIPALAYPFMPCGPLFACDIALAIASFISLGIQILNFGFWVGGCPSFDFPPWVLPLTAISLFVADGRYSARMSEKPYTRDNFTNYAFWTYAVICYEVTKCVATALFEGGPIPSLHNGIVALGLIIGNVGVVHLITMYEVLIQTLAGIYFRVTARSVPGWFWIKDDPEQQFNPFWSKVLWALVVVSAPTLGVLWAVSLEKVRVSGL